MAGYISLLDPEGFTVGFDSPNGESFTDNTTQEMFEQLELGMWYIMGQTQIPPQPENRPQP
jgi:hypothetical protein